MHRLIFVACAVVAISSAGCATGSTTINDPQKVLSLRPGVTTMGEVRATLGDPDEMLSNSRGEATWTYHSVDRNVVGTMIAGSGNAAGSYLGTLHGGNVAARYGSAAAGLGSVIGGVVGGNIGSAADEKLHDQFKDEHRSLTIFFEKGVVREFESYSARK